MRSLQSISFVSWKLFPNWFDYSINSQLLLPPTNHCWQNSLSIQKRRKCWNLVERRTNLGFSSKLSTQTGSTSNYVQYSGFRYCTLTQKEVHFWNSAWSPRKNSKINKAINFARIIVHWLLGCRQACRNSNYELCWKWFTVRKHDLLSEDSEPAIFERPGFSDLIPWILARCFLR